MTTPDLLEGIAFPFSVVLRPQSSGFQNLIITSGKPRGSSSHQFNIPRGICVVQLEWTCAAAVNFRISAQKADTSSDLIILDQATASDPRKETFTIPVERDDAYLYFQQQWGGISEDRMMVSVLPLPPAS